MKPAKDESPTVLPSGSLVPLESVLCTEELNRRPARPPDYETENRALTELVQALSDSPRTILQTLADTILAVFKADSAGASLLTTDEKRFYWPAIAGMWKPHIGGGTPRDFGPCGDVLDCNAPLLFRHFERRYTYFLPVTPPVEECLLVPFYVEGKAVGTIWAIAHDDHRKFDAEDMRQLLSLGRFASAAYQAVASLDERKRAEDVRARLASIVTSSDDAIISKDLNGVITSWNAGAERLFGYTEQEAIGQPVTTLMPPDRVNEEGGILERIRRGERIEHYETVRRRKDGTLLDISLGVSPIINAQGQIVGASKIARGISERKRAEDERERLLAREQQARQEAEAANRAKDEFLAIASHELRTPLTPILLWAHMLKSGSNPDQLLAIETIERNVSLQLRLIDDLMDLNRVKRGKIRLELAEHDVSAILRLALENTQQVADNKRVTLEMAVTGEPLRVQGDAVRLQQVFMNILSNAVKFTPPGGAVRVRLAGEDNHAVVKVRDTGEGIAPEFLPHVFEMFRQQEGGMGRSHPGLGIGLALVKGLVDLHGGDVEVRSEGPGLGVEVTVRLPLLTSAPEIEIPKMPAASLRVSSTLQGLSILLVEDSDDAREAMEGMLRKLGAQVSSVTDGREALNAMAAADPDLVLCDLAMPRMDGFEFIKELRHVRGSLHPPVIAVSALTADADHERTRLAGFAGHLNKPFDEVSLLSVVAQAQHTAWQLNAQNR